MTVADAIAAGIAFVHQELNLFDNLDAAANVFIGREPVTGPLRLVDRRRMAAEAEPLFRRLGADFGPDTPVSRLSLAQQQLLEIAKALSLDSRVVIMDEPTSSLTLSETARLLKVIADLKASGVSVIFISHRLDEVKTCADRVVVLRDGQMVGRARQGRDHPRRDDPADDRPRPAVDLPAAGDGRRARRSCRSRGCGRRPTPSGPSISTVPPRRDPRARRPDRRRADRARAGGLRRRPRPRRHDPARRPGGRDRLARATRSPPGSISCPRTARPAASSSTSPIAENIGLPQLRALAEGGIVSRDRERTLAEGERRRLDIRAPGVGVRAGSLSGGNQQKVVLAKWLSMQPKAIIFDEPTRGIDVGAKREIYDMLRRLADQGVGILMISSDMEEVIGVSDRIAVMHEGAISGTLGRSEFSEHRVLELAVGQPPEPAVEEAL